MKKKSLILMLFFAFFLFSSVSVYANIGINIIKPFNNSDVNKTFNLVINVTSDFNIQNLTYEINYSDGLLFKQKNYFNVGNEYLINDSIDLLFNDNYTIKVIAINEQNNKSEKLIVVRFFKQLTQGSLLINDKEKFDTGTYNNTFYDVIGVNTNKSGSYLSKIFDFGSNVRFNNISWSNNYGINLPFNNSYKNEINMSDNLLYLTYDDANNLIKDYSGNNIIVSNVGNGQQTIGLINNAINMAGNNYIDTGINLSGKQQFTLISLFYRDSPSQRLDIDQSNSNNAQRVRLLWWEQGYIYALIDGSYIRYPNTNTGWVLLGMVFNGSDQNASNRLRLFINGTKVSLNDPNTSYSNLENTPSSVSTITDSNLRIGHVYAINKYSRGKFDETLLFDRALNDNEMKRIAEVLLNKLNLKYRVCDDENCNNEQFTDAGENGFSIINKTNRYFQFYSYFQNNIGDVYLKNVNISYTNLYPIISFYKPIDNGNMTEERLNITIESNANIDAVKYWIKKGILIYQYNEFNLNSKNFYLNDTVNLLENGKYNLTVYAHDIYNRTKNITITFYYDKEPPQITFSTLNNTQFRSQTVSINGIVTDDYSGVKRTYINDTRFINLGNNSEFSFVNQIILEEEKNYCVGVISEDNFGNNVTKKLCFYIKPDTTLTPYILTSDIENWQNRKGWIDFYINGYPFIDANKEHLISFRVRGFDYKKIVFDDVNLFLNFPQNNITYNLKWNNNTLNYEVTLLFDGSDVGVKNFNVYSNDSSVSIREGEFYINQFITINGTIYNNENLTDKLTRYKQAYVIFIPLYNEKNVENYKSVIFLFNTFNNFFEKILSEIFLTDIKFMSKDDFITYNKKGFVTKLNDGEFSINVPKNITYQVRLLVFDDNDAVIYNADYYDYLLYKNIKFDTVLSEKLLIDENKNLIYVVENKDLNTGLYYLYITIFIISILIIISFFIKLWQMTDPATALKTTAVVMSIILVILQIIKLIWW